MTLLRDVRRRAGPVLAILAVFLVALVAAAVPARSYWIEDFAATILVDESGDITVSEEIRFYFDGAFEGIYRDIPLRYDDNLGFNYRLRMTVLRVTDANGEPLRYELSNADGGRRRIKAWVPGAQDAARTVRIEYAVQRALRFFPEHDELYWNVTGNDWGVAIESASVRVVLPRSLEQPPRVTAFVGRYGSRAGDFSTRQVSSHEVTVSSDRELAFGEGLTVVVGWEKGVVEEPTAAERAGWTVRDNWPLALPLITLLAMIGAWRRFGRDPEVGRSVMTMYQPPDGLSPAELGTLVDEKVHQRDIVATVVDLAVRGYLRIEEETHDGWFRDTTTTTLVKLRSPDGALKPHEREVFAGLFETGDRVDLEDLENEFYERLDTIRRHIYGSLVDGGFFSHSPRHVRIAWLVLGVVITIGGLIVGARFQSPAAAVGGALSGVVVMAFSWIMPARTRQGRHTWYHIKGFEEFLGRTEGDRLREMEVDLRKFEAFLPFAMALGVADKWGRAFDGLLQEPPSWYVGTGSSHQFSPGQFSRRMGVVSESVGAAMATAPRSSSGSSGFSGGGFSGGGFGGGGGGAF